MPIPDWVASANDVQDLAGKLGIDRDGMRETVVRFNAFVEAGRDSDFHRGELAWRLAKSTMPVGVNPTLGAIATPPFYGIELHPSALASAGLLVNASAQVLNQRRSPIPGLYALGNTAAHVEFGAGYQAGYTLASSMTFGYLAIEHMLHNTPARAAA